MEAAERATDIDNRLLLEGEKVSDGPDVWAHWITTRAYIYGCDGDRLWAGLSPFNPFTSYESATAVQYAGTAV